MRNIIVVMTACLLLAGCQSELKGDTYSRDEARKIHEVEYATVESTRFVIIEGTKTPFGTIIGTVIGGIAGSAVGGGKGQEIAAVLGGAAGAIVGSVAEEQVTRRQGIEIVVRYDDDLVIAIVQEADPDDPFSKGDRVRVTYSNRGVARVAH
jgi:outer membrane lipoprotein SlyB